VRHPFVILGVIAGVMLAIPLSGAGQEAKKATTTQAASAQANLAQPIKQVTDIEMNSVWADGCRLWLRVKNSGNVKIDKVLREKVWVDSVLKDTSQTHFVLEPGAVFAHGVGADPGVRITGMNNSVRALIDADNILTESNESNNDKQVTLSCRLASTAAAAPLLAKPDLVVSFEFKNVTRKDPNADGHFVWSADIEFTVTNQGAGNAGPCVIHLEKGSGPEGASSAAGPDISIPALGAKQSVTKVSTSYQHTGAAPVYRATVDAGHAVAESNENNNQFVKQFPH
jgi:hypothetical protein